MDRDSGKMLAGKLANHKREIASLTKMMTFLVAFKLAQDLLPEQTTVTIKIPKFCT
jgi:D-alanyl-D-alanine carboxypeptidase